MKKKLYKKGDRVFVWSLQSFFDGGFLEGAPAFIRQDQMGSSVLVCVERNIGGTYTIDEGYEVYAEQVKKVSKCNWCAPKKLRKLRKKIFKQ